MELILETSRLLLRPFRDSDLETFAAYRADPLVAQYQAWDLPYSLEKAVEFIDHMKNARPGLPGEWYQVALELKAGGLVIGDVAFHLLAEDHRQAEIGFTLAHAYWRQGYASEAVTRLLAYLFLDLNVHRVRAICDVENQASARLLERLGMRREGHFIENYWLRGQWTSEYWYGFLQREWIARSQLS